MHLVVVDLLATATQHQLHVLGTRPCFQFKDRLSLLSVQMGIAEADARWLFQQLIIAVDYCHRLGIANRDIKVRSMSSASSQPRPPHDHRMTLF